MISTEDKMKFKRILSALLVVASALTVATACTKKEPEPDLISFNISSSSTETVNELRADDGTVLLTAAELKTAFNFFAQYLRDYYYNQYLIYSQYYSIKDFSTFLSSTASSSSTTTFESLLRQDATDRFTSYIAYKKEFADLGLSFSEEEQKQIDESFTSMVTQLNEQDSSNVSSACQKLGITQDQFKDYIILANYRINKISDYYYGESGKEPITDKDLKDNYDKNYTRFKAVVLQTTDDDGKALSDDELQKVKDKAAKIEASAKKKNADFEKLIDEYSQNSYDISKITGDDYIKTAKEYNEHFRTVGFLYNESGYEQMFYNSQSIAVPSDIMDAAEGLKTGEITTVTSSSGGVWVIKKYDINESDDLFEGVKEDIRTNIVNTKLNILLKQWETELSYSFNDTLKDSLLDPKTRDAVFAVEK